MFIYLSKLLPLFFYPLGVVSLTIILALVFKQRERLQRWSLRIGLIILWLAGNRWVSSVLHARSNGAIYPRRTSPRLR